MKRDHQASQLGLGPNDIRPGPMRHHFPHHQQQQHPHHHHPHHHQNPYHQQHHFNNNNINHHDYGAYGSGGAGGGFMGGSGGGGFPFNHTQSSGIPKGKQLMSFQAFVKGLNNSVDEHTAFKKYKDFMADLTQSKVGRFFEANKDREWFKSKYHPVESQKIFNQQNVNFLKRLKIFNDLNERNYFDTLPFTSKNSSAILNLLDAIKIQLDDGPQELIDQLLSRDDTKVDQQLKQQYVPIKPTSVVIDDISIETTYSEIHQVCIEADPNLLRIAYLDPYYVEGGNLRQKVVAIYKQSVDIREVCWKLSRSKLNNRSLVVSISKCVTKRIHLVNSISNHPISIVNDIRNVITLMLYFDELKGLYGKRKQILENCVREDLEPNTGVSVNIKKEPLEENEDSMNNVVAPLSPPGSEKSIKEEDEEKPFDVSSLDEEKEKEKKKLFEFRYNTDMSLYRLVNKLNKSNNPLLEGAYVYLVEYIESAHIQHLISKVPKELITNPEELDDSLEKVDTDKYLTIKQIVANLPCALEESTRFLDKMLWYLRIVHSFDYYKRSIYRQEDELTLRIGLVHLRDVVDDMNLEELDINEIKAYLQKTEQELVELFPQSQKYVTKDEERYNYRSYGKVITDELTSYAQRIQKPKSTETEEVYKCKHCSRVFQKLSDIGRHFVSKHRWAIDAIEVETDFFNAYLFDTSKINPCPPKELLDKPPNRFARLTNFSEMGEDPDLLQQTIEAYNKMESFVREPAPRAQVKSDPRNETVVDYTDISFDDAI